MGKKAMKASKNHHQQQQHKQPHLSSFIKVLKPKVYIIDSSHFKTLVQQLTGNGSPVSSPTPPTPTLQEPALLHESSPNDNSSEGSVPTSSFGSVLESSSVDIINPCAIELEEPFNILYHEFPDVCNDLESWDFCPYDNHVDGSREDDDVVYVQQEGVSVFDYDICASYDDYQIQY